ncbi:SGNH hydrolase-type esterase domain-containing protein [Nemania sp. NC0429]|nr:SGNH hydrolase-type esterase domain-containing protein [Nemania sp. NC0429]
MFPTACFKLLTISVFILALIGVFTYDIVDYDKYVHRFIRTAEKHQKGKNDNSPVAGGLPLRIMFVGASISRGEQSTGDRGYRKHIRDTLTGWGNDVNCVGFTRFGDFEDNDVEAWGAYRIRTITKRAAQSVPAVRPNLILVQVGTSDCFQRDDTGNIGTRMKLLADTMLQAEPRATVILSTLTTTPNEEFEPCILDANRQIRDIANEMILENKPVVLTEMHYDQGLPGRPKPEDIVSDRIHPTDAGYLMMGEIFLEGIRRVEFKGFLQHPTNNSIPDNGDDGREVEDQLKKKAEAEHPIKPKSRRRGL